MTCKNCAVPQEKGQKYCSNCGSKIIDHRISVKSLFSDFSKDVLGWDNKYFRTVKDIILRPEKVVLPYLDGTRKRYMSPLAFFSIGTAIAVLIFNVFADEYLAMVEEVSSSQSSFFYDLGVEAGGGEISNSELIEKKEALQLEQIERQKKIQEVILKYFNLFSFLYLPFYALFSFFTYRKLHTFGEHLVINAYTQGVLFITTISLFLLSIISETNIFLFNILLYIPFYSYVFSRIHQHSFKQALLKFLRFLLVFIGISLLLGIVIVFIGVGFGLLMSKFK